VDGIPRSNQKPGVIGRQPMLEPVDDEYPPGHGEGHNSGMAAVVVAGIALKEVMQRNDIKGTLKLWPGIAEELLGTKAHYVREGYFDDVDATLFAHVSNDLSVSWGKASGTGVISMEFTFRGSPGHGASPELGRSALDAVELMAVAMEYRREHLPVQQRTHHVVTQGGDQPNVIPEIARVWYYLREDSYDEIMSMRAYAEKAAQAAAEMTETELLSVKVLGTAWPQHMNKPLAETAAANMDRIGMPEWSADDQAYAKAVQESAGNEARGLRSEASGVSGPPSVTTGGGSDDIGDISWKMPTITIRYPANIPSAGPSHTWWHALAMATPIAHKGTTTCAKVYVATVLDLLMKPEVLAEAKKYFDAEQGGQYKSLLGPDDTPATHLNRERMARWKPELEKLYYDPSKYESYLQQLDIPYPGV
jgi:aminobenzoyl-glutamate utilization protein B